MWSGMRPGGRCARRPSPRCPSATLRCARACWPSSRWTPPWLTAGAPPPGPSICTTAALEMAERVGDRDAIVAALRARQMARSGPDGATERLALGDRLIGIGTPYRDDKSVLWAGCGGSEALAQLGEVDRARAELDPIAATAGDGCAHRWPTGTCYAAALPSRWPGATSRRGAVPRVGGGQDRPPRRAPGGAPPLARLHPAGRVADRQVETPLDASDQAWAAMTPLHIVSVRWRLAMGRAARRPGACYGSLRPLSAAPASSLLTALYGWAARRSVRRPGRGGGGGPRCCCRSPTCSSAAKQALSRSGSARLPLGLAAGTLGRLDDAVRHLRAAAEVNQRAGVPPFTALARYHLARMLARRRRPGDRAEAALATSAAAVAGQLGMARCGATPAIW